MEKSFIAHPWIQRSVVGLEEYSAHDWRAATSGTARPSYLARVGPVVILAVAPCQPSRVTPCLVICAVFPPGGAWQRRLNAGGDILREKLVICAHFLPRDVAFSRCARRRLAEGVILLTTSGDPGDGVGNVPRCTVQNGDGHISVLSGALRDVWQIHCGICKTGLLLLLFDRSVQIVLRYL